MSSFFENNMSLLRKRFPELADFALSMPRSISIMDARDGGVFYAVKEPSGKFIPLSNPVDPIACAQKALDAMAGRLEQGFSPALLVGLAPGYVLETVFRLFESQAESFNLFRQIYVLVDSPLCLCAWLLAADRTAILKRPEVEFHLASKAWAIAELCERDIARSHLFIPISELPAEMTERIIDPLAKLFLKRDEETTRWRQENEAYYDAIPDEALATVIQGGAGRKPRLLMPTHMSSTVIQFSSRDTCELFERAGWETRLLKIEKDLPPWRLIREIHEFKPDLFIFIDHLRTEDADCLLYPKNMLFATWVQDSLPAINSAKAAAEWNARADGRRRDVMIGYVNQVFPYGYRKDRLFQMPMVVNARLFHPVALAPPEKERFACDVCFASNRGESTESVVEGVLLSALSGHGFSLPCLVEAHDALWADYRAGRSYSTYDSLRGRLERIDSFRMAFERLSDDDKDYVVQRVFWLLNDLVYRYVVLEWLDEYAADHPGFKLNLYGRGWGRHPRFGKYAQGGLEHGRELNLAYNGARFCLHLNSMEGQHQRILEIVASGGLPLTRSSSLERPADADVFNEALDKLFSPGFGTASSLLSEEERGSVDDFAFFSAIKRLKDDASISNAALKESIGESLERAFLNSKRWPIPQSAQRTFNGRDGLFAILDAAPSKLDFKDGVEKLAAAKHVGLIQSFLVHHLRGGNSACHGVLDDETLDFIRLLSAPESPLEKLDFSFAGLKRPGEALTSAFIQRVALSGDAELCAGFARRLGASPDSSPHLLNARLSLILHFMKEGDFRSAGALAEEIRVEELRRDELHPDVMFRLLFVEELLLGRPASLSLERLLRDSRMAPPLDLLAPYSQRLPHRLALSVPDAIDKKAFAWLLPLLTDARLLRLAGKSETPKSLDAKLSLVLRLMADADLSKAKELAASIDFEKAEGLALSPNTKLRLLFVDELLLERRESLFLAASLETRGRGVEFVLDALRPYSLLLPYRLIPLNPAEFDVKAFAWIMKALDLESSSEFESGPLVGNALLNPQSVFVLRLMKDGDWEKAKRLASTLDFASAREGDQPPQVKLRLRFIEELLLGAPVRLPLASLFAGAGTKCLLDALMPWVAALEARLVASTCEACDAKAVDWISEALIQEDAACPGAGAESRASMNIKLSFCLHLMSEGAFEKARKLFAGVAWDAWMGEDLHPNIKFRLLFLGATLAEKSHPVSSDSAPAGADALISLYCLQPFLGFLLRKIDRSSDCVCADRAIEWLASSLVDEPSSFLSNNVNLAAACKILVASSRRNEALAFMANIYGRDASNAFGFTYLSLCFSGIGLVDQARACVERERAFPTDDPNILFMRSSAWAFSGFPEKASASLAALYASRPRYLLESGSPIIWGVLGLLLKALGHERAGSVSLAYAESQDKFNYVFRARWNLIPSSDRTWTFPPFAAPFPLDVSSSGHIIP